MNDEDTIILSLKNALKKITTLEEKIKHLEHHLSGYVMPTQWNAIMEKQRQIEEKYSN